MFVIELDFLKEMTFIVEKDAALLKDTAWIIDQSRELQTAVRNYNENVMLGWHLTMQNNGLPTNQLERMLQRQLSIVATQCLLSYQLIGLLLRTIRKLEDINAKYKIHMPRSRVTVSDELAKTMKTLRRITNQPESNAPA